MENNCDEGMGFSSDDLRVEECEPRLEFMSGDWCNWDCSYYFTGGPDPYFTPCITPNLN